MLFPSYVSEWPTNSTSAFASELVTGSNHNGFKVGSPKLEVGLNRIGQTQHFKSAHSFDRSVADGDFE
jgi:hypothetical protein